MRSRNGWSFNPTPRQFRYALRHLIVYAGKSILTSTMANCTSQDETSVMTISLLQCHKEDETAVLTDVTNGFCDLEQHETILCHNCGTLVEQNTVNECQQCQSEISNNEKADAHEFSETEIDQSLDKIIVVDHGCSFNDCRFCINSIIYITGYLPFSVRKSIKCGECLEALRDSEADPCGDKTFLLLKNYVKLDEDWNRQVTEKINSMSENKSHEPNTSKSFMDNTTKNITINYTKADRSETISGYKATPAAKRIASENHVDITKVSASGKSGTILKKDIIAHLKLLPSEVSQKELTSDEISAEQNESLEKKVKIHKGLFIPSGSLCKLIFLAEKIFRDYSAHQFELKYDKKSKKLILEDLNKSEIYQEKVIDKLIYEVVKQMPNDLFPTLQKNKHAFLTSLGAENHFISIIKLMLKKFFALRVKKKLKDRAFAKKDSGNFLQRSRIVQGK